PPPWHNLRHGRLPPADGPRPGPRRLVLHPRRRPCPRSRRLGARHPRPPPARRLHRAPPADAQSPPPPAGVEAVPHRPVDPPGAPLLLGPHLRPPVPLHGPPAGRHRGPQRGVPPPRRHRHASPRHPHRRGSLRLPAHLRPLAARRPRMVQPPGPHPRRPRRRPHLEGQRLRLPAPLLLRLRVLHPPPAHHRRDRSHPNRRDHNDPATP